MLLSQEDRRKGSVAHFLVLSPKTASSLGPDTADGPGRGEGVGGSLELADGALAL